MRTSGSSLWLSSTGTHIFHAHHLAFWLMTEPPWISCLSTVICVYIWESVLLDIKSLTFLSFLNMSSIFFWQEEFQLKSLKVISFSFPYQSQVLFSKSPKWVFWFLFFKLSNFTKQCFGVGYSNLVVSGVRYAFSIWTPISFFNFWEFFLIYVFNIFIPLPLLPS